MVKQPAFDQDELDDADSVQDDRANQALFLDKESKPVTEKLDEVLKDESK